MSDKLRCAVIGAGAVGMEHLTSLLSCPRAAAVALAETDTIELNDLPLAVRGDYSEAILPSARRNDTLRVWAGRYARLILERCDGNKREACRVLGISYHTLQAYVRIQPPVDESEVIADAPDAADVGAGATECSESVEAEA